MKKWAFIVLAVLVLPSLLFAQTTDPFQSSREWKKLKPNVQQVWIASVKNNDLSQKIECFLVLNEIADAGDADELLGAGFVAQVLTGTIVRGHTYVKNLPQVAKLFFVREINLAQ